MASGQGFPPNSTDRQLERKYELAVRAHDRFFRQDSTIRNVYGVIKRFREQYQRITEDNPFECDITHFPSRSRIFLLSRLVEMNLQRDCKDVFVTFKLDSASFRTRMRPESVKRGNIYVYDIGSYEDIQQRMGYICSNIHPAVVVRAIRAARTSGRAITQQSLGSFNGRRSGMCQSTDVEFLNRFMFLWDCEIARLLPAPVTTDDRQRDEIERWFNSLPIGVGISSVHYFIERQNFRFDCYLHKESRYHFFTGQASEREDALKCILIKRTFGTEQQLLRELALEFGDQ